MARRNTSKRYNVQIVVCPILPSYRIRSILSFPILFLFLFFFRIEEKSDFDFMDEMSSPRLPVRRIGESTPKGSAKKKTASFNGVLSTMLRHRRLEQQEINSSPKKSESSSVSKTQSI